MIVVKEFYFDGYNTTVEAVATFHKELYGQDADGNRGEWRWFLDDYDFSIPLRSNAGRKLSQTARRELEELARKACDENIWEF